MSAKDAADLRQDRRQWLKTSATVFGASLVPLPAVSEQTSQAQTQSAQHVAKTPEAHPSRFFTPAQYALVEELSETIIPGDSHSGGAKAAQVAHYIDQVLRESFDDTQKALWREGLRLIDVMSQHYHGKNFVNATVEDRIALLTILSDHVQMTDLPEVRFFIELKRMTVTGYYTSKIGIHDELEYKGNRVIQDYVGCDDQNQ
jgi:hypothetical protein